MPTIYILHDTHARAVRDTFSWTGLADVADVSVFFSLAVEAFAMHARPPRTQPLVMSGSDARCARGSRSSARGADLASDPVIQSMDQGQRARVGNTGHSSSAELNAYLMSIVSLDF